MNIYRSSKIFRCLKDFCSNQVVISSSPGIGSFLNSNTFYQSSYVRARSLHTKFILSLEEIRGCGIEKILCNHNHNYQQLRGIRISVVSRFAKADNMKDEVLGKGEKILKVKLATTRLDAVIKAGLGMSKNKIEKVMYDDRIRVNGERPKKKSEIVYIGDEIDVVRGFNKLNSDFLDVARVEIIDLKNPQEEDEDDDGSDTDDEKKSGKIPGTLRRSKMLTIKNYSRPWKGEYMEN